VKANFCIALMAAVLTRVLKGVRVAVRFIYYSKGKESLNKNYL
jgi:hypothetical protein